MADGSPEQPGVHLEVEAVLDVDPGFAIPDLAAPGVPPHPVVLVGEPVVHELDAAYFDTPDLRLIRSGITLRRRTGGDDAGWHLKLPEDLGTGVKARLEIVRPLGNRAAAPPAALLALVQAWLRGRDVVPVARLRTTRTVHVLFGDDGGPLAELADDAVVAEVATVDGLAGTTWRELEIELTGPDGGREFLAAVAEALVSAGARPAVTSSKLARALNGQLEQVRDPGFSSGDGVATQTVLGHLAEQYRELLAHDPLVRLDLPAAVPGMLLACGRLRAALAAFRPVFTGAESDRIRTEVAWIADVLGDVRDAEVMREGLLAEAELYPDELLIGPIGPRIELELGRQYREAHAVAVRALDSARHHATLESLQAFLADPPLPGGGAARGRHKVDVLVEGVGWAQQQVEEAAQLAATAGDLAGHDQQLDQVRAAAETCRYVTEAVAGQLSGKGRRKQGTKKAKQYVRAAGAVQEVLGDHRDAVVLRARLLELGARAHRAGESAFGYGVLHTGLAARMALDEQEFARAWHDLQRAAEHWPG